MIVTAQKSGHNPSASLQKWDKMMADYSWFLPSVSCLEPFLIEASRRGDPMAQLKLYKYYHKQMFDISYRIVCNSHAANEIARESFIVAFEKTGSSQGQVDFISFLKRLVEEKSLESWKRSNTEVPGLVTDRVLVK